jgi:hypothetical protein
MKSSPSLFREPFGRPGLPGLNWCSTGGFPFPVGFALFREGSSDTTSPQSSNPMLVGTILAMRPPPRSRPGVEWRPAIGTSPLFALSELISGNLDNRGPVPFRPGDHLGRRHGRLYAEEILRHSLTAYPRGEPRPGRPGCREPPCPQRPSSRSRRRSRTRRPHACRS